MEKFLCSCLTLSVYGGENRGPEWARDLISPDHAAGKQSWDGKPGLSFTWSDTAPSGPAQSGLSGDGVGGAFLAAITGSTTPPVLAASLPLAPSSWRPPWLVMVPGTDPPLPHLRLSPLSTLSLECHSCCAHTGNPCSSFQN